MKSLPAGIENGFEIFKNSKKELKVLIDGEQSHYTALPSATRDIFRAEMYRENVVISKLRAMGCNTEEEMELKFVACRYGSLDETPDLVNGKTHPDAPCCPLIGHCAGCGKVCILPDHLTQKEYQVVTLTAAGKLDKEIGAALKITKSTCRTYFARIHEKLHVNNRIEIALWAHRLGIL
jgi:DNA-binding CsgD family transcriptional regulator